METLSHVVGVQQDPQPHLTSIYLLCIMIFVLAMLVKPHLRKSVYLLCTTETRVLRAVYLRDSDVCVSHLLTQLIELLEKQLALLVMGHAEEHKAGPLAGNHFL